MGHDLNISNQNNMELNLIANLSKEEQAKKIGDFLDRGGRLNPIQLKQLSDVAKPLIKQWDEGTKLSFIEKYINDRPRKVLQIIDWFEITDDKQLEEFAIKAINASGPICEYIDKFNIKDENIRIKIAKMAIREEVYDFPEHVEKFNIRNQEEIYNIAKMLIPCNAYRLCRYIKSFNIKDESKRIEIAKALADRNGRMLPDYIKEFNISDEKQLLEIARRLSITCPLQLSLNIKNFDIKDENERIKIAETIIKRATTKIPDLVDNFEITKEEDRIKLAKLAVKNNPGELCASIKTYKIKNEEVLFDLLKEVLVRNKENMPNIISQLKEFKINNMAKLNYVFNLILTYNLDADNMMKILKIYKIYTKSLTKDTKGIRGLFHPKKRQKNEHVVYNVDNMIEFYENKIKELSTGKDAKINFNIIGLLGKENTDNIENVIKLQENEKIRRTSIEIVEKVLFALENSEYKHEHKDAVSRAILDIVKIRSAKVKDIATTLLVKNICDGKLDNLSEELKINSREKAYITIFSNIFDRLSLYNEENKDVLEKIRGVLQVGNVIKDSKSVQDTILTLLQLDNTYLDTNQINDIIRCITKEPSKMNSETKYVSQIINFNRVDKLENIDVNNKMKDIFYGIYKEYLGIEGKEFMTNYEKFVNQKENVMRRLEEYIMIYVSKKNTDKDVMEATRKFIEDMGNKTTFEKERYDISQNSHLAKIKELSGNNLDGIYNRWTKAVDLYKMFKEFGKPGELESGIIKAMDTCNYEKYEFLKDNNAKITDDPVDLFLIGTEVEGSCQSVAYNGEFSSCLMGYVLDGKNKAIVIKDEKGKIKARCIIRLLIDEQKNEIVMVREKMYTATGVGNNVLNVINERAIDYAKWLGVSLVCDNMLHVNGKERYVGTLSAIGGNVRAPYEYVDSAGKNFETANGYKINNNDLVYLYKKDKR